MDSLEAITKKIQSFCEARDWDKFHSPKDLAIGISTEANELLDLFRFKTAEDMDRMMSDEKKRSLISDELADVFYFLIRFAQMYDFDLLASLERKMTLNEERYSVERSRGSNVKYDQFLCDCEAGA
ncbi:MAG TPA: nucleotide pyrophosphohydrolase [Clostridiaceae bacterium]|jgi:NTP pyrophosphatase (non-canonical NTP hydrolase)|nr:nucleotide pyrophosphohydrolase [Clostridiaceae bacterium]